MYMYCDPAHGWLKVPLKALFKLGIADKISSYSYINRKYAFLEEDCDLAIYLKASGKTLKKINIHYADRLSKIRSYESYELTKAFFYNGLFS